ncbi:Thiol:disulfide interchange protein DsbD precursor [Serratia rubidaea]|uniref:Thiol:disulfide interchange protein DsbD n=1 Tax=Serratia rubidaea TaxID=61652 RepID=A0A447QN59_SERRU|nr:Thiol:disulfide interchange protein DsbD precursor [Serratia rubidaea]
MDQRIIKLIFLLCSLFFLPQTVQASLFGNGGGNQFVPVDRAFAFDFQQQGRQLTLNWQIRAGYYLYRQQIKLVPQQARLADFSLPQGIAHKDEFFGETEIYQQQLQLPLTLLQASENASLSVTYQGCAAAGFCYPPETRVIPLDAVAASSAATPASAAPATPAPASLPFSPLWALLIGIGIAFTPCVLPMYPLISGIILGRERPHSSGRILLLALVYVQGMALTYTLLGLVVAAAGLQFQAALQHPYVLIGLSVLFIALALSMFGCYSLQLPSALQTRLANWSNTQRGGSLFGVFVMGALAGLICSPCTTAPLSAILLYIAQSGNMWAGGGTLYLYALGMGIPLIIVTLFGNRLLPRSGPWMQYVKRGLRLCDPGPAGVPAGAGDRRSVGLRLWSLLGLAFFGWPSR